METQSGQTYMVYVCGRPLGTRDFCTLGQYKPTRFQNPLPRPRMDMSGSGLAADFAYFEYVEDGVALGAPTMLA